MKEMATIAFLLALSVSAGSVLAGETVDDPRLGFRISLPDGFAPDPSQVQNKIIHAFRRPPEGEQQVSTILFISRLGGVLSMRQPPGGGRRVAAEAGGPFPATSPRGAHGTPLAAEPCHATAADYAWFATADLLTGPLLY